MKKVVLSLFMTSLLLLLAACSASDSASESKSSYEIQESSNDMATGDTGSTEAESPEAPAEDNESSPVETGRMIIHNAKLSVNVKELDVAQSNIEKKVKEFGGYIVESNVYQENEQTSRGSMIVRIPEKHFENFLTEAEGEAAKILERNVTGQDVTEQYVDLESRVNSKRAVEARLLEFMGNAEKTEDLLKISSDLAKVQEEIEVMVGKMKFLQNQTSFATIELTMYENRVIVPGIDSKELNTWDKTKKQLATSTNSLLATGSALIVFFIGNLPVLLILGAIGYVVYFIIRRRLRNEKKE